jgi:hypothetical protein
MSTPVTRGELREELGLFEQRFDGKIEHLEQRFDGKLEHLEQRFDGKIEIWGGALLARIDAVSARVDTLTARVEAGEQRILAELARHAGAIQEAVSRQISAIDEKYADLPARVSKLEEATFGRRRPRNR